MDIQRLASNLTFRHGVWYSYQNQAISYPSKGNENSYQLEDTSFWFQHRNNCIIPLVKKYRPQGHFFDIGGGNGYVSAALDKEKIECVLVEPGADGIEYARKRGLRHLICSTVDDAGFKKNSISAIGVFDVVEHIRDDKGFLTTLFDLLQPGGRLFISVPAYSILWSNEDILGGHFRRYTLASMGKTLKSIGFKINYETYIFSFLPLPIFFLRTLPDLFRPSQKEVIVSEHERIHRPLSGPLKKILDWEIKCINSNKKIFTGGSCLMVAQKDN